jgi:uncharacterized membrane protein
LGMGMIICMRWSLVGRILVTATLLVVGIYLLSSIFDKEQMTASFGLTSALLFVLGLLCLVVMVIVLVYRRPISVATREGREMDHPKTDDQIDKERARQRRREIDNVIMDQHFVDRRL